MSAPAVAFAVPADVELAPNPINPDWIIEGNPQARAKRLAESADGTSSVIGLVLHARPLQMALCGRRDGAHHFGRSADHRRERQNPPPRAGRHGLLPGRQPQHLASHQNRAQARGLPPQQDARELPQCFIASSQRLNRSGFGERGRPANGRLIRIKNAIRGSYVRDFLPGAGVAACRDKRTSERGSGQISNCNTVRRARIAARCTLPSPIGRSLSSIASSRRKASRPATGMAPAISITSRNWSSPRPSMSRTPDCAPSLIDGRDFLSRQTSGAGALDSLQNIGARRHIGMNIAHR